jgi:hypothetical protein
MLVNTLMTIHPHFSVSGEEGGDTLKYQRWEQHPGYSNLSKKSSLAFIPVVVVTSMMAMVFIAFFVVLQMKSKQAIGKGREYWAGCYLTEYMDVASNDSQNDDGWMSLHCILVLLLQ